MLCIEGLTRWLLVAAQPTRLKTGDWEPCTGTARTQSRIPIILIAFIWKLTSNKEMFSDRFVWNPPLQMIHREQNGLLKSTVFIYLYGKSCPLGMTIGWIRRDDENPLPCTNNKNNHGGTLQTGKYNSNTWVLRPGEGELPKKGWVGVCAAGP